MTEEFNTALTAESTASEAAGAMSKSKKKRLKRARAKLKKEQGEQASANTPAVPPADSMNPLDKLRRKLMVMGYELVEIHKAMDDMWQKDLQYDNFDAVLAYLGENAKNAESSNGSGNSVVVEDVIVNGENGNANENANGNGVHVSASSNGNGLAAKWGGQDTVISTPSSSPGTSKSPQYKEEPQASTASHSEPSSLVEEEVVQEEDQPQPQAVSAPVPVTVSPALVPNDSPNRKKKVRVKPVGLAGKLEIVANNENLTDATIALTEWVTKAATPPEIKEFCSIDTPALQTLIRRTILSRASNTSSTSTGQLLDLIGSILRTVNAPSSCSISTAKSLAKLLQEAANAMTIDTSSSSSCLNENIAKTVAEQVVTGVGAVVEEMILKSQSMTSVMSRLEGDIRQLEADMRSSALANGNGNAKTIVDIMMKRDKCKSVAEKYSSMVQVSLDQSSNSKKSAVDLTNGSSHAKKIGVENVMKDMLGDQYQNIVSSREKMTELKDRENQSSAVVSERDAVRTNIESMLKEQKRISSRKEQLLAELAKLEKEEKAVQSEVQTLQEKLTTVEGSLSKEAKEVSMQLDEIKENVKVEEFVKAVAQQVSDFADAMESITRDSTQQAVNGNGNGTAKEIESASVGNTLASLLTATSRYFSSESSMIAFLRKRAAGIQEKIPSLTREINEYEALGMASTVKGLRKKEQEMLNNVMDDNDLVEGLVGEAGAAKAKFVDQLQGFLVSPAFDISKKGVYAATLKEIDGVFTQIGIASDARWSTVMTMYGCDAKPASVSNGSAPPAQPATTTKPKEKKMGWNLSPEMTSSTPAKSLLDIQKEELM